MAGSLLQFLSLARFEDDPVACRPSFSYCFAGSYSPTVGSRPDGRADAPSGDTAKAKAAYQDFLTNYYAIDPKLNYGVSNTDRKHAFVLTSLVKLPLGKGKALRGRWQNRNSNRPGGG